MPGGLFYNAPYLDATDPESATTGRSRAASRTSLATERFGSHELKGGGEYFVSTGIGGNSQSSTGAVFVDRLPDGGRRVVRDAEGSPVPVFTPGVSEIWTFQATRGARIDIKTTSLYLQDRWMATPRLTLDLGTRIEIVRSDATGDITTVDTSSIVPRLAASYDLQGNGTTVLYGTYGHYSGKYSQVQFGVNTNVGRPNEVDYVYSGPAGSGGDFAPGFDLANYTQVVFRQLPDGERPGRRWHQVAAHARVHGRHRPRARQPRSRQGDLRVADDVELRRGLRGPDAPGPRTCRSSARSRTGCSTTPTGSTATTRR